MQYERTEDIATIRAIVTHPKIYPMIGDDGSPKSEDWQPPQGGLFVVVRDGDEILGLFAFFAENSATVKVHTCLLPCAWGLRAKQAALGMVQWIWDNTDFVKIITDVPEYNRLALRFAKQAGFKQYGLNHLSYRKGGKLFDQIELGLCKPEAQPCH